MIPSPDTPPEPALVWLGRLPQAGDDPSPGRIVATLTVLAQGGLSHAGAALWHLAQWLWTWGSPP